MHKFMDPLSVALIGTPRRTGAGAFNNAELSRSLKGCRFSNNNHPM
jgi:hypothetical protein